ncbi:MAG: CPBP family intramembrane metalloprotease [Lonepinella koalarum]|nr:CPBP family intramembrane metalloprotease [Lonepinella koalarum]
MMKKTLNIIDILLLTLIFFGSPIYDSLQQYVELQQIGQEIPTEWALSDQDNYDLLIFEMIALFVAFIYLRWRHFDFKQLNFSVNKWTLPLALLFILLSGGITHLFYSLMPLLMDETDLSPKLDILSYFSFSLILVALLNGFYEEVYFLGLIFAVPKNRLIYVVIFSLVVRFLFHTYQGLFSAVGVALFGIILVFLRWRFSVLIPFMLAHSFFDVFGLGLPF